MKHIVTCFAAICLLCGCNSKPTAEPANEDIKDTADYYDWPLSYEKTGIILGYGESFHTNDKGDTIYSHLIKQYNDDYTLTLWYWEDSDGRNHDTMYWIQDSVSHIYELDEAALDTIDRVKFR